MKTANDKPAEERHDDEHVHEGVETHDGETITGSGQHTYEQLGYKGETEHVDAWLHTTIFECKCGNVRYVAPGDLFQVDACKPCVARRRKDRRNERARRKRAEKRAKKLAAERKADKDGDDGTMEKRAKKAA